MILNRSFTGQVVNAGFQYVEPQGDSTPDAISGQTLTGVELSTLTVFNPVQITGIDTEITASITGGEMSVSTDGITYGAFSSANQTVENNYWIRVRATSSASYNQSVVATLSAGGITAYFSLDSTPELTNGVRVQLRSRTTNQPLLNGVGFEIHVIEKGLSITELSTDSQGYLIIQDVLLDTIGEEVGIAVSSTDGEMTGFMRATIEDLTTYLI